MHFLNYVKCGITGLSHRVVYRLFCAVFGNLQFSDFVILFTIILRHLLVHD